MRCSRARCPASTSRAVSRPRNWRVPERCDAFMKDIDTEDIAERTRRRITRRLMPFLFVLYIFNYLNRVNVGYAALQMRGDLGFSNTVFGFGAGIFFIGYFLLQIPSTLVTELWSARKFITLSFVVWGAVAALCGLVNSAQQFYWVRFFLRIAQAGFFPGI